MGSEAEAHGLQRSSTTQLLDASYDTPGANPDTLYDSFSIITENTPLISALDRKLVVDASLPSPFIFCGLELSELLQSDLH